MDQSQHILRLLIVDDDLLVRMLAAESLKAQGFEVDEAGDGPDGLAQIEQRRPDLILLDVMMPGMDGYEVCRTLRERPECARIPVIMLTGLDDTESIERAYESGATDFISKPINATLLAFRVRYALRTSRMLEEIYRHRTSLTNAQRIAHLGNWTLLPASGRFECSAEFRKVIDKPELGRNYHWRDILPRVHPDDAGRLTQAMDAAIDSGVPCSVVYRIACGNGTDRTIYEQVEIFRDSAGCVVRLEGTAQDITERVMAEERMRQLADYDGLTGLANRKLFSEIMQHGLSRCSRQMSKAAVLDINLDRFKRINETLGHVTGDEILKEFARRIVECIRASDLAGTSRDGLQAGVTARLSGDSFAVFLSEIKRAEDAALIARRINAALAQPMQCAGHDLALTASVGIAVCPDNGTEVGTLLKNAETAMHQAKARGAGAYCFFAPEMNARATIKLDTENELRLAIERDELMLFFQGRVDVPTGRLAGAEALVRWQHPLRGLVPPNEFIPIAEESGLIAPLTAWVVRAACRQQQQWQRAGLPVVPVSINLSTQSFREDGLVDLIAAALQEYGIAPSLLEGEITESMLMQDVERGVLRLNQLRALGIELAMDDFGTGYSSLAYLKRFPLSVLKIDRAFVKDVLTDANDAAIAATIITLSTTMGMTVVAEGMEQVEQANFLLARGCRLMQGFLFARPLPADAFAQMLRTGITMPPGLRIEHAAPAVAVRGRAGAPVAAVSIRA